MFKNYIKNLANNKEIYFRVRISPGADKTEIKGKMADGTLKIAVSAPPENGRANKALVDFLAEELEVRKYQVKIVSGLSDKSKLVKVSR